MAAMSSVSLLSVQARPARQFGIGTKPWNARPRSFVTVSKVTPGLDINCGVVCFCCRAGNKRSKSEFGCLQACGKDQVQNVAQKALALLAASQLLAAPIAGLQVLLLCTYLT